MIGASAMYEFLTYITIQKFNAEKRTAVPRLSQIPGVKRICHLFLKFCVWQRFCFVNTTLPAVLHASEIMISQRHDISLNLNHIYPASTNHNNANSKWICRL